MGQYRVPADVASRVHAGHPWVYREALGPRGIAEQTGAVIDLIAGNREFLARGYVDREHAIAVRILSRDPAEVLAPGKGAIAGRFARAVELRRRLHGGLPEALRLFSGENEGLPGVTVDCYGDFVVVQWLSAGALAWRDELYDAIEAALVPRGIYEQRRLRPLGGSAPPEPAGRVRGEEAPVELVVGDGACRFGIDVTAPLGVGLFLDMRLGWAAVAARAAGRRMLNLFSYTGAFSVHAAKAGASEVVAVDLAAKAHARARRNYELSGLDPARLEALANDVVKTLDKFADRKRVFDLDRAAIRRPSHRVQPGSSRCRAIWRAWRPGARWCWRRAACSSSPPTRRRSRRLKSIARSPRGARRQAPTCASSSAWGCRPTSRWPPVSPRAITSRSRSRRRSSARRGGSRSGGRGPSPRR